MGVAYQQSNNHVVACDYFETVLKTNPYFPKVHEQFCMSLLSLSQWENAAILLKRILTTKESEEGSDNEDENKEKEKENDTIVEKNEQKETNENHPNKELSWQSNKHDYVSLLLALCLSKSDRYFESEPIWRKLFETHPENIIILNG